MSDEEKKAIQYLNKYCDTDLLYEQRHYNYIKMIIRLVGKQSKEIEELKEKTKKCEYYEMVADELYKNSVSKDKIKAKIEELDLAIFKNQTIYTVNKMQEIKFARLCLAELLEKE